MVDIIINTKKNIDKELAARAHGPKDLKEIRDLTDRMATALKHADTSGDGKVSVQEFINKLSPKERKIRADSCQFTSDSNFGDLFEDLLVMGLRNEKSAAQIAVNKGLLTEVRIPDLPTFCKAVAKKGPTV